MKYVKLSLAKGFSKLFEMLGIKVTRIVKEWRPPYAPGDNPYVDMQHLLSNNNPVVIFDVGANVGQSTKELKSYFPKSKVYCFEPNPSIFDSLQENVGKLGDIFTYNFALGAKACRADFLENIDSTMSSFLELGSEGWGNIIRKRSIEVRTIDDMVEELGIQRIDILKTDTQGYDLEVLYGAAESFKKNIIGMVYCEICFADLYKGQPSFEETCKYLRSQGFRLAAIYTVHYRGRFASWTDVLFVKAG
jgi:FkbM family methyltransferase